MPTYEYLREDGTRFEFLQKMSDSPLTRCPETGQTVKRVISGGTGVIYKGTGFYNTDYKKQSGNGSSDASAEKQTPAASSETADTKPGSETGGKTDN